MTGAFSASPLTVWVGPTRYVFHPGRDVIVGYGSQCDLPLDPPGNPASQTARPVLVLRFSGTHWVAIDRSPDGMFGMFGWRPDVDDRRPRWPGDHDRRSAAGSAIDPRCWSRRRPASAEPARQVQPTRPDTADHSADATADVPTSAGPAACAAGRVGAADGPDSWTSAATAGRPGTDRADEHHQAARHSSCAQLCRSEHNESVAFETGRAPRPG